MWKEAVVIFLKVLLQHLSRRVDENYETLLSTMGSPKCKAKVFGLGKKSHKTTLRPSELLSLFHLCDHHVLFRSPFLNKMAEFREISIYALLNGENINLVLLNSMSSVITRRTQAHVRWKRQYHHLKFSFFLSFFLSLFTSFFLPFFLSFFLCQHSLDKKKTRISTLFVFVACETATWTVQKSNTVITLGIVSISCSVTGVHSICTFGSF